MAAPNRNPFLKDISLLRERIESFEIYPFSIPAIRHLTRLPLHPAVTYFVGENGTGKSTLLEAIALVEGFNLEGGGRSLRFWTRESHSELGKFLRVSRAIGRMKSSDGFFLRAESFYNVASEVDRLGVQGSYGGKSLHEQSHGESFLTLMLERLGGNGLYLFDEPEAALSQIRQMSLLTVIHHLIGRGSQFIIATHSPIVLAYPDATIYQFSSQGIAPVDYTETESYKIAKSFIQRRPQMLAELLRPLEE